MNARRGTGRIGLLAGVVLGLTTFGLLLTAAMAEAEGGTDMKKQDTVTKTDAEWKRVLTPMQYKVLREKATERPGTGEYLHNQGAGTYLCAACGNPLFVSDEKFDSGCGWPSFSRAVESGAVREETDTSLGMRRTEVLCARCGGHLGHVFKDGPPPTGRRYCINSAALTFRPAGDEPAKPEPNPAVATFSGGCFWCIEAVFERLDGVLSVESGYTGGTTRDPTYREVCGGRTGHAEAIRITYDPSRVSYEQLLDLFWRAHDPTTLNRQGADVGTQYRSAIFYHSEAQKRAAERSKAALEAAAAYDNPVVTEIVPAGPFYPAEVDHQDYFRNNSRAPYCQAVIAPKLKKLNL